MYIRTLRILRRYAVPIKVHVTSGETQYDDLGNAIPGKATIEERNEPVVPTGDGLAAALITGGTLSEADLIWVSTKLYPMNTVVDVPSQGGTYRVQKISNYHDYSDAVVYELKGDSLNGVDSDRLQEPGTDNSDSSLNSSSDI